MLGEIGERRGKGQPQLYSLGVLANPRVDVIAQANPIRTGNAHYTDGKPLQQEPR